MTNSIIAMFLGALVATTVLLIFLFRKRAAHARRESELAQALALSEQQHRFAFERAEDATRRADQLGRVADELKQKVTDLALERTTYLERLRSYEEKLVDQRETLTAAREEFRQSFSDLSLEALSKSNAHFLALANEVMDKKLQVAQGDLETRHEGFEQLTGQIKEVLGQVHQRIDTLELARREAQGDLTRFLTTLSENTEKVGHEAHRLRQALTNAKVQGRWGEMQLRNVVESAGMLEHCDFIEQTQSPLGENRSRPDMVVRLPNNRCVVVDAKAPLTHFLEAHSQSDHKLRSELLRAHASAVKEHIRDLSQRDYPSHWEGALEHALLFLPGESFFFAALEEGQDLVRYAQDRGIILVTPLSLIAFLRAVAFGWREVSLQKNAEEIRDIGRTLHDRLEKFQDLFVRVGRNLNSTVKQYNQAARSFESRLVVSARRLHELGATSGKPLPSLDLVTDAAIVPERLDEPFSDEIETTELDDSEKAASSSL